MGLRQYFGRSILSLLKEVQEKEQRTTLGSRFGSVLDHLQSETPAMVVFSIGNGYLVRYGHPDGPATRMHFCADLQAISEFLIAEQTKEAMGLVPKVKKEAYGQVKDMQIGGSFTKPYP